ncbi:phosphohydrolase [bacterium (Candidatus Howlettbacteria) CG23_combo_of_CG06-09_8_20_14_all_37_9]|nr:MAG: phosphohydrolase [bacterium (Candidatus Howlettbacteria) CG23_combo_of_CG06-09_8_20_14_all_37_9]
MELVKKVEEEVREFFSDTFGCHDWDHIERVYHLCLHIGKKEKADLEILQLAALLHDIGRKKESELNGKVCHAEVGAKLAREILEKYKVAEDKMIKIIHCIETHRFRGSKVPKSKEAKILFDADRLDSIGAIGLARAYVFAGELNAKVHDKHVDIEKTKSYTKDDTGYREFLVKLRHVKERMLTEEGKRIAEARHDFMEHFFERINLEVDGEA